ncbi:hypothetical protein C8R47DRAFT_1080093 [Mycena vitilis]|nr:hypothetical protein C8R47DRAFT_1080093 [Mycena vitilis]
MPAPSRIQPPTLPGQLGQKFPGREFQSKDGTHIKLEDLYLVTDHLQRPAGLGHTRLAGLLKTWDQEKLLETPDGDYKQIKALGYLELGEGDTVFSHSRQNDQNPMHDVIQIWVASRKICTPQMKTALDAVRDSILGPRVERTRKWPAIDETGKMVGGTAYERSTIVKSVKPPARAYTMGPSLESPTSIMAPMTSVKVKADAIPDPAIQDRYLLLEVCHLLDTATACTM